uniref:Type II toxin-antitoxin system RelE/ParE family toxin n=1 Tax=Candidatus Kentrum sp. LFY TaxID=2126342 RepID=A0A450UGR5_9GAMM|nr:MAG: hypothetical protein BECKLFY1418B_GA0070995_102817 [Candidatus Kentron sp. LFY]
MPSYELTPAAESDLREIAHTPWIDGESDRPRIMPPGWSDPSPKLPITTRFLVLFLPVIRKYGLCNAHINYVFYLQPKGKKPRIIAVLHERMELLARIADRLSP